MPCPRRRTTLFFDLLKLGPGCDVSFSPKFHKKFAICCAKTFFFLENARNFAENLQLFCAKTYFFFGDHLCVLFLVLGLGLEHFCLWPREALSSESWSLASDFFCVLGLEPYVLDSTSDYYALCSRL